MGYRVFTDNQGREWEVRDRVKSEWEFVPMRANTERPRVMAPPGYEADPFELSQEELQRLIDQSDGGGRTRQSKSPFKD
jgi:hypothetical protein